MITIVKFLICLVWPAVRQVLRAVPAGRHGYSPQTSGIGFLQRGNLSIHLYLFGENKTLTQEYILCVQEVVTHLLSYYIKWVTTY